MPYPQVTIGMRLRLLIGTTIAFVAMLVVVGRFRRFLAARIPSHWIVSPSGSVRLATRAVKAYATYLVAFYTLIAVVLLFQILGTIF